MHIKILHETHSLEGASSIIRTSPQILNLGGGEVKQERNPMGVGDSAIDACHGKGATTFVYEALSLKSSLYTF